jgi:hypothetical protein
MTKKQLEKFVKLRNKSPHASNLQFQIDAEECGFKVSDLGEIRVIGDDHFYMWDTPHGFLREHRGVMSLEPKAEDIRAA